jgi:hypothetical protein
MSKRKILIQLDSDAHASVFDSVVAVDADVDHLLQYAGVEPTDVRDLVYGAMFTRGPDELHNTAIFIGGSNVAQGESLLAQVVQCFFGPMRVSVMLDANGANTTAAAAVLTAARHLPLASCPALVLAATGPVGQRVVRLLAKQGVQVRAASRSLARARETCQLVASHVPSAKLTPMAVSSESELLTALEGVQLVIAAGAAGVELLPLDARRQCRSLKVAIDLNAVAPTGIAGIKPNDKAVNQDSVVCYGAIGVGGTKMKIHKAAIRRLFEANNLVLDADEIFEIGRALEAAKVA